MASDVFIVPLNNGGGAGRPVTTDAKRVRAAGDIHESDNCPDLGTRLDRAPCPIKFIVSRVRTASRYLLTTRIHTDAL